MRYLSAHDRPREKLVRLGSGGLGDDELLAVVLGNGGVGRDALALSGSILARAGGLHNMPRLTYGQLRRVAGVGPAQGARILAAIELGRRTLVDRRENQPQFQSPQALAQFLLPQYGAGSVEQFGAVLLDTKHRLLRTVVVSVGTLDSSPAHPREVFREATIAAAAAVVLFHNHPSGDPVPSADDCALTDRLLEAGRIIGIRVLDHLILASTRYFSFREAGRL